MGLRDVLGAGGIGGVFAAVADLLVTGGDVVWFLVEFLIDAGPLLYVLMARLSVLAERLEWIPMGSIRPLMLGFAGLSFAVLGYRLLTNLVETWRDRNES